MNLKHREGLLFAFAQELQRIGADTNMFDAFEAAFFVDGRPLPVVTAPIPLALKYIVDDREDLQLQDARAIAIRAKPAREHVEAGCYADCVFGHQHCREILAGLVEDFDPDLADLLREEMSDDAREEYQALELLSEKTDKVWLFYEGSIFACT